MIKKIIFFIISVLLWGETPLVLQNPATKNAPIIITSGNAQQNNNTNIKITKQQNKEDYSVLNRNGIQITKNASLIGNLAARGITPDRLKKIKKKMDTLEKALSYQNIPTGINENIKFKPGEEITVKVKRGFSTIINVVDDAGNPVKFTYLTIGNNLVKVTQFGNKLEITPLAEYAVTNLIAGIKGYNFPITFNIQEVGEKQVYDNYINLSLVGTFPQKVGSEDIRLKSAILQEVFKYSNINQLPQISYEVYSLKTKKPILFTKNILKIYKVQKFGKTYYLVLINKNFIIYGNKTFGTYDSTYNIYFLNFNQNVFTIRTNPALKLPYPMVERYRIVIKDF